jgi:hypothetical protein
MAWLILLIIAWGALAFGAIYDWARWPLLVGCVVAGAWGFGRRVPRERRGANGPIFVGLALVAAAASAQLVPLDSHTIRRWSPATHEFLLEYDLRYALPAVEEDGHLSPGAQAPGLYTPRVDPKGSTSTSTAATPYESRVPSPESRRRSPSPVPSRTLSP